MKDITGMKFGKLTALYISGKTKSREYIWHCVCGCGNETDVRGSSLRSGNTKSCGCYNKECEKPDHKKHGMSKTRIYKIWKNMRQRCYCEKNISYYNYGAKGIRVCDEWNSDNGFINFYNWSINNGYDENLTIDRIDCSGNYTSENCRWITNMEQQSNKTNNHYINYNGKTYTLSQLAREFNIKHQTLEKRLKRGWDLNDALLIKPKVGNNQNLRKNKNNVKGE